MRWPWECRRVSRHADALDYLRRVLEADAGYCAAHQQAAQIHQDLGDLESARDAYRRGIESARRKGDTHAAEEMAGALASLE